MSNLLECFYAFISFNHSDSSERQTADSKISIHQVRKGRLRKIGLLS